MENGSSGEIAVVGNEGMVGISLFMGGETTPSRAVVQSAGHAYRVKASVLKKEFALGGELQHLSLRYTQALEQAQVESEMLQKSLARVNAELATIDAEWTQLLSAEKAEADAATRAASEYVKAGTFGYQVWNDAGTHLTKLVDEAGNDLPGIASYSYEVVDDNPPLPSWAK